MSGQDVLIGLDCAAAGCLRSSFWLQMYADAANISPRLPAVGEATALGAAAGAAVGAGIYPDLETAADHMAHIRHAICPDPEHAAAYRQQPQTYRDIHTAFASIDASNGGAKPRRRRVSAARLRDGGL